MSAGHHGHRPFVPALGFRFLNPLYDTVLGLHTGERRWKGRLVEQMQVQPGQRILDVGCGTGTLDLLIKEKHPQADVVGIDPDTDILGIARSKTERAGVEISFDEGYADRLPYADSSFDRVVSSLVFHHLPPETKAVALREIRRVLRPGGEFHLADIGRPSNPLLRIAVQPFRLFDGVRATEDNLAGRLPSLIAEAGFTEVVETGRELFGVVYFYRASVAGGLGIEVGTLRRP
jgi:SAM-dependent methyltransferase